MNDHLRIMQNNVTQIKVDIESQSTKRNPEEGNKRFLKQKLRGGGVKELLLLPCSWRNNQQQRSGAPAEALCLDVTCFCP